MGDAAAAPRTRAALRKRARRGVARHVLVKFVKIVRYKEDLFQPLAHLLNMTGGHRPSANDGSRRRTCCTCNSLGTFMRPLVHSGCVAEPT